MIKFTLLSVGKTKESWLDEALQEYLKRLQGKAVFQFEWVKEDRQLIQACKLHSYAIGLDSQGAKLNSLEFAAFLQKVIVEGNSRLAWVIGGSEGLPLILKKNLPLISLSNLTFTHQLVRLVLVEQIYRALEIAKNSPYHK